MSQTFIQTCVIGAFMVVGNALPGIVRDAWQGEVVSTPIIK